MSEENSQLEETPEISRISPNEESSSAPRLVQISSSHSGPIPSPGDLERYEAILAGAANRILKMAENAQANRHERDRQELEIERLAIAEDSKRSYLGVAAASIISLVCIGGGIYLITRGHGWEGTVLIGIDLAGLVSIFVYGTKSRNADRRQDDEAKEE